MCVAVAIVSYGVGSSNAPARAPDAISVRREVTVTATARPQPVVTATAKPKSSGIMVWIPRSGKRYHDSKKCSWMKSPKIVTLEEAKEMGYTPCGNCDPPR